MAYSANLGFPRIGADRELKKAIESYWQGKCSRDDMLAAASNLRARHWSIQDRAGINFIPTNDFSLYDQTLDTIALLGAVPERFRSMMEDGKPVNLETYFAMARGIQNEQLDAQAMEMTKWFDTNYHYIVPELSGDLPFRLSSNKPFDEFNESLRMNLSNSTRPVLLGPVSFLLLGKIKDEISQPLDFLDRILPIYREIVIRFAEAGAEWIQFDEPCMVLDQTDEERNALVKAYSALNEVRGSAKLWLQTYFGRLGDNFDTVVQLPVQAVGLDLTRDSGTHEEAILAGRFPADKHLVAGIVDGRNVWINPLERSLERLEALAEVVGSERLIVSPSCSLLHVPYDAAQETGIDLPIRSWLAFAQQKLDEVNALTRALNGDHDAVRETFEKNREARNERANSTQTKNPDVRKRVAAVQPKDSQRASAFPKRHEMQVERLHLPFLPTTTIGSFPQTQEVRAARRQYKDGKMTTEAYEAFMQEQIKQVIQLQEELELDVLVHGEFERNDMVEYFGEQLDGFVFTSNAWVQSYGTRCVKPPILYGDVARPKPMTVNWTRFAASCTKRHVKGMLTGPVTILNWSFVRDDQPREDTCRQIALAIRDEVVDLEAAGVPIIQIDEAALREGLPLRRSDWQEYLDWATECFRLSASGVRDETQIHTHMCYSEFNEIIDAIDALDADVITIENSRSGAELLEVFRTYNYRREIGPGVYDIHSPRVPSVEEMVDTLEAAAAVLPAERLWVNPDCGLKTRGFPETQASLANMVEAAKRLREKWANGSKAPR